MKLDILVLASHPDDAELGCGGTIAKHVSMGLKVGIVDLTKGELGTRGTPETRAKEAADAAKTLGIAVRENLGLRDGFFRHNEHDQLAVIAAIRKYQPDIVLANALRDRHPDHGKGADLAFECCFLAGLSKVKTELNGTVQNPWRPRNLYHYIQSDFIEPDFIVDVSDFWETKMNAIRQFRSQFHDPSSKEPETYISSPAFLSKIEARGIDLGTAIGVKYGEGFNVRRFIGIGNLKDLL